LTFTLTLWSEEWFSEIGVDIRRRGNGHFPESTIKKGNDLVSSKVVKNYLFELIEKEDKSSPYSDDQLEKILKEEGYEVARRTVSKYREQLNIPVARLRKEY